MTDSTWQPYVRRRDRPIVAVRLALDTDGLVYRKWGGKQTGKAGDWLVDSDGDVYTVDADSFARTYQSIGPGHYVKTTPVWARRTGQPGSIATKEGVTHYEAGWYLVSNDRKGSDAYAVKPETFEQLYVLEHTS